MTAFLFSANSDSVSSLLATSLPFTLKKITFYFVENQTFVKKIYSALIGRGEIAIFILIVGQIFFALLSYEYPSNMGYF